MNKTISTPPRVPSHSDFVPSTIHTVHKTLPSPTVRMLTCVNYLIPPEQKAVKNILAHAAQHVGGDGLLCLSQERLAYLSGYTSRSVRTALRAAVALGYIKLLNHSEGRGISTRYKVVLLARYPEAAARSKWWRLNQNPEMTSAFAERKEEISIAKGGNSSVQKAEMISADPNDPNKSDYPYLNHEETKADRARVLVRN
jgi:hypothetical protein